MMKNNPPIFIVGAPRSGTTLLASFLDRHSRICVPPETRFFREVNPSLLALCERGGSRKEMIELLLSGLRIQDLDLNAEDLSTHWKTKNISDLFLTALEVFAQRHGKSRPGEKSPVHLHSLDIIFDWYPDARVVHIIRDGRDVVLSLQNVVWSHNSLVRHCFMWRRKVAHIRHKMSKYDKKILTLKYKELVTQPVDEIQKVCSFIGENFEKRMLDVKIPTNVVPDWEANWKGRVKKTLDPSRVNKWKHATSEEDLFLMQYIMGDMLRYWGYPLKRINPSLTQKLHCFLKVLPHHPALHPHLRSLREFLSQIGVPTPKVSVEKSIESIIEEKKDGE